MNSSVTLRLPNRYDALTKAAEDTTSFLEARGAPADAVFAANLAIEELVTNIVKYGYDDNETHEIVLVIKVENRAVLIEISDDGHPFNPFDQPDPDTSLPAEERPIGGLGIHFVRNMLDTWDYARREGRNVVTLTKKLSV